MSSNTARAAKAPSAMRVMLDTNILLDYYLVQRKDHDAAVDFITSAYRNDITLLCTAASLKDFYYIHCLETKRHTSEQSEKANAIASAVAWGCVENILEIVTVHP